MKLHCEIIQAAGDASQNDPLPHQHISISIVQVLILPHCTVVEIYTGQGTIAAIIIAQINTSNYNSGTKLFIIIKFMILHKKSAELQK